MKTESIKVGDTLIARSLFDYDCIYTMTILKRTPNTATFTDYRCGYGATRTSKIRKDWEGNEFIRPDLWSMAPTFFGKKVAA